MGVAHTLLYMLLLLHFGFSSGSYFLSKSFRLCIVMYELSNKDTDGGFFLIEQEESIDE